MADTLWVIVRGRSLEGICRTVLKVQYKKPAEGETEGGVNYSTGIVASVAEWRDLLAEAANRSGAVALLSEDGVSKSGKLLALARVLEYREPCDVRKRLVRENGPRPTLDFESLVYELPGIEWEDSLYCSIGDVERAQKDG